MEWEEKEWEEEEWSDYNEVDEKEYECVYFCVYEPARTWRDVVWRGAVRNEMDGVA